MRLRILSLNVHGLGMPAKWNLVPNEPAKLDFDFSLLQETHISSPQAAQTFAHLWRGKCFWFFGVRKSAGVAVLVSPRFSGDISRFWFDSDGRILSLLLHMNGLYFHLLNIFVPNAVSDCKTFFETLHQFFLSGGDTTIGGNFNCIASLIALIPLAISLLTRNCFTYYKVISVSVTYGTNRILAGFLLPGRTAAKHKPRA